MSNILLTPSTPDAATPMEPKTYTLAEFFESCPPGSEAQVAQTDKFAKQTTVYGGHIRWNLTFPDVMLHCDHPRCGGDRAFKSQTEVNEMALKEAHDEFIYYLCRNCGTRIKAYSIRLSLLSDKSGRFYKFGEVPDFGPPLPQKVSSLIGSERDYFFKGRRSENQGLGIAAFAYYRRVVENQKDKLFDEIIKVAQKLNADSKQIADLQAAKAETQFTKAVAAVKHGLPEVLFIDGHSPLTLLHDALSEGLHAQTDEQCLSYANAIRVVLYELVERADTALRADKEMRSAVALLTKAKDKKPA
jgi:hypothetical protein